MTYPHSWGDDHDAGIRVTCYLIAALSIVFLRCHDRIFHSDVTDHPIAVRSVYRTLCGF